MTEESNQHDVLARWKVALHTEMTVRSGAVPFVEELLRGSRGPRRRLTWTGLFTVQRLAAQRGRLYSHSDLASTCLNLPVEAQATFGILDVIRGHKDPSKTLTEHIADMFDRLAFITDSAPETRPYLEPSERVEIAAARAGLADRLASGWLPDLPAYDTHVIDSTALASQGNRKHRGDPHARLGYQTPTDPHPSSRVFGYHVVVLVPLRVQYPGKLPYLIVHHAVVPANVQDGPVARELMARRAAYAPLHYVVADRGLPNSDKEYALGVLELGGQAVHDLPEALLGQQGTYGGAPVVDAWLMCPGLPANPYWALTRGGTAEVSAATEAAGAYREHFFCRRRRGPASRPGYVLYLCPARAGKCRCPLVPASLNRDPARYPEVPSPPSGPVLPTLCTSDTGVEVPLRHPDGEPTAVGRGWEALPRLGRQWTSLYPPARAAVENVFATLTTSAGPNLDPGRFTLITLPKTALIAAQALAVHNHTRLWSWWRAARAGHPGLTSEVRDRLEADLLLADRRRLAEHYDRLFPPT